MLAGFRVWRFRAMASGVRISSNEREFVESALRQELRIDGRRPFDTRRTHISFAREDGAVEVQQGETRVLAVVSAQLGPPYTDRPNEGSLAIYTEFSPMADPAFEPGRPGESAVELGRIIDRGLRESRAVDTESLCVLAGKAVWALRIDIHILDNGGNLVDIGNVAALAGLLSFRRPECTLGGADGQEIIVHPPEVREPLPLILHHLPIAVTFGFFADGELVVVDPSLKEEAVMGGRLTITVNAHGEVCAVQKGGGVGVRTSEIMRCLRVASSKAADMAALLKKEAESHEIERAQRKIRRHRNNNIVVDSGRDVEMLEAGTNQQIKVEDNSVGDTEMDSGTDSEDEQERPAVKEEKLFEGGYSSWNPEDAKPLDGEALQEFELAAKLSAPEPAKKIPPTELQGLVSAASVYQQYPQQSQDNRPLGPIFAKESADDEMGELQEGMKFKPKAHEPTSLLDAVKKKPRKRKKGNAADKKAQQ